MSDFNLSKIFGDSDSDSGTNPKCLETPKGRLKNAILTATSQKKPKHGPDTDNFIKKLSPPPIMPDLNLSEMFGDFDSVTNESTLTPDRPESISKWRAENCNYDSHIPPMQKKPKTGAESENFIKKLSPPQNEIR
jgi:hypothetical protein